MGAYIQSYTRKIFPYPMLARKSQGLFTSMQSNYRLSWSGKDHRFIKSLYFWAVSILKHYLSRLLIESLEGL